MRIFLIVVIVCLTLGCSTFKVKTIEELPPLEKELYLAVKNNNLEGARDALGKGAKTNITIEGKFRRKLLTFAIENQNVEMVSLLIESGCRPNALWGLEMPLSVAVLSGNSEILALCMSENFLVPEAAPEFIAAYTGDVRYLTFLRLGRGGFKLIESGNKKTALLADVLFEMRKPGEIGLSRSNQEWKPLHTAAKAGNTNAVKELIALGADVDPEVHYVLFEGMRKVKGTFEIPFKSDGKNITIRKYFRNRYKNCTPLEIALLHGHENVVDILEQAGGREPRPEIKAFALKGLYEEKIYPLETSGKGK